MMERMHVCLCMHVCAVCWSVCFVHVRMFRCVHGHRYMCGCPVCTCGCLCCMNVYSPCVLGCLQFSCPVP